MKQLIDWTLYEVCYNILFAFFCVFSSFEFIFKFLNFFGAKTINSFFHCQRYPPLPILSMWHLCRSPGWELLVEAAYSNVRFPSTGSKEEESRKKKKKHNPVLGQSTEDLFIYRAHSFKNKNNMTWKHMFKTELCYEIRWRAAFHLFWEFSMPWPTCPLQSFHVGQLFLFLNCIIAAPSQALSSGNNTHSVESRDKRFF